MKAGEVWEWWWFDHMDERKTEIYLVLEKDFMSNNRARRCMLSLETGKVEILFPEYNDQQWTRIA